VQSTASLAALMTLSNEDRATLVAQDNLLSLLHVFRSVPDPRSRHGKRYGLPLVPTIAVGDPVCSVVLAAGGIGQRRVTIGWNRAAARSEWDEHNEA
jgi:hypothetical protein